MRNCPHCGRRLRHGRAVVHLSGDCLTAWYQRERERHPGTTGRPKQPDDLSTEAIEHIMARVAAQQRYNRQRAS